MAGRPRRGRQPGPSARPRDRQREPEIAVQIDPALYERDLALTAMVMDVDEVAAPLKALRG